MQMPLISPAITPRAYPPSNRTSECQVLSNKSARSLIKLWKTAAGPGKYGSGSQRNPDVITSQAHNVRSAAAKIGPIWRMRLLKAGNQSCATARRSATARKFQRNTKYERVSTGGSVFETNQCTARQMRFATRTGSQVRHRFGSSFAATSASVAFVLY